MVGQRWIGVDEYLPTMKLRDPLEEGGRDFLESDYVLVWDGHNVEIALAAYDESGLYWLDRFSEVVKAKFWMPLPTPPEQSEGDEK